MRELQPRIAPTQLDGCRAVPLGQRCLLRSTARDDNTSRDWRRSEAVLKKSAGPKNLWPSDPADF
jgi:hypothetical protein